MAKTKIKKLEDEVKDATVKADHDVEKATEYYHDFMSDYAAYQSDLRRRSSSGGLRKGSGSTEEGDRQPKNSHKKAEETNN
jgi:hypothetical protein